ncbi:MAG: cytidine deaminase [Bacteroidetes bacterium 4484_249]|nr:MAG: cytidine deaminase [Bacteroidetes bacterium 4484_249]
MKKKDITISYSEYESIEELSNEDHLLLVRSQKAVESAYAPYSTYHVGAAVLLENGEIITGSNQENAAYPSGLCAERVALFYASSQYPDVPVKSIAISARAREFKINSPVTPCGSCRQVMAETENRFGNSLRLIMRGGNGNIIIIDGVKNILPLMFQANELKK